MFVKRESIFFCKRRAEDSQPHGYHMDEESSMSNLTDGDI